MVDELGEVLEGMGEAEGSPVVAIEEGESD